MLVVLLSLLAAACAPADATTSPARDIALPVSSTTTSTTSTIQTPTTTTTTTTPSVTSTTDAPSPYRTLIATARASVPQLIAYETPGGDPVKLEYIVPNPHQFGGPLTLMIVEGEQGDEWLKAQLPMRPNGQEGWIEADDYIITSTTIRAEVDLSDTSVKVYDGAELIGESQAAIGTARTPTPLGTFFIAAKRTNPPEESHLGTHAVVLSGFSEALDTFSGGLPVIAIHGTNNPDGELGHSVSNGCVRVPNDVVQFLARTVPIGAPVIVRA